jgi:hypothetical protein
MNHWIRLALPVGLGVVAAVVNWATVSAKLQPEAFVAVNVNLAAGQPVRPADLAKIELSGDLGSLREAAIPWEHRAAVYHRAVPRDLVAGDIVLWRDATALLDELPRDGEDKLSIPLSDIPFIPRFILVGQEVGFWIAGAEEEISPPPDASDEDLSGAAVTPKGEYVGPFRVLAVGERATPGEPSANDVRGRVNQVLTIAVKLDPQTRRLDEKTQHLLSLLNNHRRQRIVAILLHSPVHRPAVGAEVSPDRGGLPTETPADSSRGSRS